MLNHLGNSKAVGRAVLGVCLGILSASAMAAPGSLNMSVPNDAIAQQGISWMSTVASWLLYFGGGVVVIALMVVGYKMIFAKHQWGEVANIVMGGCFIGGAAVLGGLFFRVIS